MMRADIWRLAEQTAAETQYGTFEMLCKVAGGQVVALEIRNVIRKWSLDDAKSLDKQQARPVE